MRIRTIKPEFFTHEGLFEAESESGLPLRIAFVGLWCVADREGRFKWEPRRLGVQILPYDNVDFSRVLHALTTRGFVVMYRVDDACFGCIPSFQKHQIINNREADSVLPPCTQENAENPNDSNGFDACPTRESRDDHASKGEGKGREGKGKEGKGESGACAPARSRFVPPTREELDLEAAKIGLASGEVDRFVNYYGANGWRVGRNPMRSWPHALAMWASRSRNNGGYVEGQVGLGTKTPTDAGF